MPSLIGPDSPSVRAQTIGQGANLPTTTGDPLALALSTVGKYTYCWGGTAPPCFDCSGFIYWVYNQVGIPLARPMASQLQQGINIPLGAPGNRLANAMPGDVVYFGLNNADPSRNHEGMIASTNGVGTMVNAECTACGPINVIPIGEGTSDEPISAIRRFTSTTVAGTGGNTGTGQAQLLAADCQLQIPLIDICVWKVSYGRALLGAALIAGAGILAITGVYLMRGKGMKVPSLAKPVIGTGATGKYESMINKYGERVRTRKPGPIGDVRPPPTTGNGNGKVPPTETESEPLGDMVGAM